VQDSAPLWVLQGYLELIDDSESGNVCVCVCLFNVRAEPAI
jgi:hypothetical protein